MSITKISPLLTAAQQKYAVESGIPIAPQKKHDYPFLTMEVGDSFALNSDTHRECINVRGAISYCNKLHKPMKFSLRIDASTGKYRCWRVA